MPKKQPKRRAWRKAKIEDVEEAVEDERLVKKLKHVGGAPKSKKAKKQKEPEGADAAKADEASDEEGELDGLFTVDTSGSGEGLSAKTRREIARAKLFPAKGPNIGLSASEELKVARAENRLKVGAQKKPTKGPEVYDLWGADATAAAKAKASSASAAFPQIRKRKYEPVKVPGTLHKKVGVAPAVLPAHEGQSMNPDINAYEDLACTAAASFLEKEKENAALDRKMRPLTHGLKEALGADAVKGLSETDKVEKLRGLVGSAAAEGDDDDEELDGSIGAPKKNKQKSQSFRNKEKKRKVTDELASQETAQRRMEKSVGGVGALLKDIREQEEIQRKRKEQKAEIRREKHRLEAEEGVVPRERRLGKTTFVEQAAVIPDVASASRGMRAARLKGSAIHERLSSIARRGLINAPPEASKAELVRHSKKNARVKKSRRFISPLMRENLLNR
eukprot:TRINITY_DN14857_c0_g1_i1.p1 TRINITY_DN14857_c0_g1~~TRINITY_DN14857_c0_g1_i1.p1  ORF type:complete len:478 (+),score=143.71 TRINITY_DN14857_c0_g1_i1:92-1435(+)